MQDYETIFQIPGDRVEEIKISPGILLIIFASIDNDANEDAIIEYFVNTSYTFNSNVNAYIELGGSDVDDTELGYPAGMQVTF